MDGHILDPICLADDLDLGLEVRISALAHEMGIEIKPPVDTAFWSFAFRNVPGLWPVGWGQPVHSRQKNRAVGQEKPHRPIFWVRLRT